MGDQQSAVLSYAIRPSVFFKYTGQLCVVLAMLSIVPMVMAAFFGDMRVSLTYLIIFLLAGLAGYGLSRLHAPSLIQVNEALAITAVIFLLASLLAVPPMMMSGLSFSDAFFEALSAVTTTGLSTLPSVEHLSRSFLFSRAWLQWIGGLGIIVFTVAILLGPGMTARRLVSIEETEDIVGSTRLYARTVFIVYSALSVAGFMMLVIVGMDWFSALTHTLAAISTGGFSPYNESLRGINTWHVRALVMLISFAGALSLALYYRAMKQGWRLFIQDLQFRSLFIASAAATVLLGVSLFFAHDLPLRDVISQAPLMAVSAQTTTGFTTLTVSELDQASRLILIASMLTGGSIGSTAGGIKILRIVIFLRLLRSVINRTSLSQHAVVRVTIGGQPLDDDEIQRVLFLMLLFVFVLFLSWTVFIAYGYEPLNSLFEVVSAMGTVGLSSGISSPELPSLLRGVLCADMLMGRLEIISALILLYPGTWIGRRMLSP
jgi:trk system potassium uptake protein TrkH